MKIVQPVILAASFSLLIAAPSRAAVAPIPQTLAVPAGQSLALTARGTGFQIYACTPAKEDATHYSWSLKGPEATLQSKSGARLGKHYAGPTWEARDGSKVVGEVAAKADAPESTAIPWLLLRATSTGGAGTFSSIVSVQRVHTVGGKAPLNGCDAAHSGREVRVPYKADYRFFK